MRPKYRIIIQKGDSELTVTEIALVDQPAIEIDFLYFKKEPKPLYFNEDKMTVAGPLMLPNKMIWRLDEEGNEYDVYFTEEDIENARYNFKKWGLTGQFNEGHSEKKLNVVLLEDYILEENDPRVEPYGFQNLPKGTWFGITKVEDFDTWIKIKSGELRGFSVEGLFQLKRTFNKEKFVIEPKPDEEKGDFITRCLEVEKSSGMSEDQALAVCYRTWEDFEEAEFTKEFFTMLEEKPELSGDFSQFDFSDYTIQEVNFDVEFDFPDWMTPPEVKYFYDAKPGAQFDGAGIIDSRSRKFCINMVNEKNRGRGLYTYEQILAFRENSKYNVFLYAGGKNCRHTWYTAFPGERTAPELFKNEEFRNWRENNRLYFESYDDYPKAASEAAQTALDWAEKNGWGSCGTAVGKARANQLAKGEPISRDTIARMAAFERHRQNSDRKLGDGCGRLMWLAWGGDAGIEWASRKLEQLKNEELNKKEGFDIINIENKKNDKKSMNKVTRSVEKFVLETKLEDGTEVYVDGEELVVGVGVKVKVASEGDVAETDMWEPAPDGTHTLEDGTVIVTEGGVVTEIKEEETETEGEEVEAGGKKKYKMEITEEDMNTIMSALQPKFDEILSMISELASKISDTEEEEEVEAEKQNFGKVKTALSNIEKIRILKEKFNIK